MSPPRPVLVHMLPPGPVLGHMCRPQARPGTAVPPRGWSWHTRCPQWTPLPQDRGAAPVHRLMTKGASREGVPPRFASDSGWGQNPLQFLCLALHIKHNKNSPKGVRVRVFSAVRKACKLSATLDPDSDCFFFGGMHPETSGKPRRPTGNSPASATSGT